MGGKGRRGYGRFNSGGHIYAHRFAYQLVHGPLARHEHLCHQCDNPPCVNPSHMVKGTPAINSADMVAKGRQVKGERSPFAKLTRVQAEEIRRRYAEGHISQQAIADEYNVSQGLVSHIINGRNWVRP
jgi:hypothetical protein